MKSNFANRTMAVFLFSLLIGCTTVRPQEKQPNQPNLSADEQKLVGNIMSAKDAAAKLSAAAELIKKHPQTPVRQRVAENMANQVANVKDNAQKLTLAQQLGTIFSDPAEIDIVGPVVVEAYAGAN